MPPLFLLGDYNYLQVSKPGLNIPLDAHMVQPEYVSYVVFFFSIFYILDRSYVKMRLKENFLNKASYSECYP